MKSVLRYYLVPLVASVLFHGGLVGLLHALPGPARPDRQLPPMEMTEKKDKPKEQPREPEPKKPVETKVAMVKTHKVRRVRRKRRPPPKKAEPKQAEPTQEPSPEPQNVGPKKFGLNFKGTTTAAPGEGVAVPRGDSIAVDPRITRRGKKPKKKPRGFKKVYQAGEVAPMAVLTTRPTLLRELVPEYPEQVKDLGIEGQVKLRVTIDAKGKVIKVKLLTRLHPALDKVAIKTARKLRFKPATVNGVPVTHTITYAFSFVLE